MTNMGNEQYSQETFKAVYDQDPQIKDIVNNFDAEGITLVGGEEPQGAGQDTDNTVDQMAQSATSNAMS